MGMGSAGMSLPSGALPQVGSAAGGHIEVLHLLYELRRRVGYVFQFAALFDSMSVLDNVAMGLRRMRTMSEAEIRERVDHSLTLVARRAKLLSELAATLETKTHRAAVDLSDTTRCCDWIAGAEKALGPIDVLINNAGISIRHDFLDITPEEWDELLAVNLRGVFYMAQTAARHMVENGSGVILNTASTAGSTGYPHYADYSASKGGVIALTLAMALELAPKVRVNAISPGYVLTPMQRAEYTEAMLRAVNRMHDLIPGAGHAGEIPADRAPSASAAPLSGRIRLIPIPSEGSARGGRKPVYCLQ